MTYVDPGSLFDNLQRVNDGSAKFDEPTDDNSEANIYHMSLAGDFAGMSSAFFGDAASSSLLTDESVSKLSLGRNNPVLANPIDSLPYQVAILGVPESGARSRTETQVRFVLRVLPTISGFPPLKELLLPSNLLSDESKATANNNTNNTSSNTNGNEGPCPTNETSQAYVKARVWYSDRDEAVYSCYSCILRERKRSFRKRSKSSASTAHVEVAMDEVEKNAEQDRERILLFASQSTHVTLLRGEALVPIRLTCYCRHQDEKVGYRVSIELYNQRHCLLGRAVSPPILITDDHKRISRIKGSLSPLGEENLLVKYLSTDPQIAKVVPAEGPMHGGIEITILGDNLAPDTVVIFGSLPANIVSYINPSTMVVRLPPSQVAGVVSVTVAGQEITNSLENTVLFTYKNDLDRAMMELALQLIGMKMTGRVDDARDIALRIINEFNPVSTMSTNSSHNYNGTAMSSSLSTSSNNLERVLITCLAAAVATGGIHFTTKDLLYCTTEGEQTLLHLAALASFDILFEYLANIGGRELLFASDLNGLTPCDLYFLSGRQRHLESMGLDEDSDVADDDDEGNDHSLTLYDRYQIIRRRTLDRIRGHRSTILSVFINGFNRIRRRPARIRNHLRRVRNLLWRRFATEADIKDYYLQAFEVAKVQNVGARIFQSYQEMKPPNFRLRDAIVWYGWVPIVLAVILVWYFDFTPTFAPSTPPTIAVH